MMRLLTLAMLFATGCSAYVPRPPAPVDPEAYTGADPRLVAAMTDCQTAMASAYDDARFAQRVNAWLTFTGGSVAATGAAASTGIAVLWQGEEAARVAAVTTGAVAIAGAVVALASRIPQGPEGALEALAAAQVEWQAGIEAADAAPALELKPGDPRYERAIARLRACRMGRSAD